MIIYQSMKTDQFLRCAEATLSPKPAAVKSCDCVSINSTVCFKPAVKLFNKEQKGEKRADDISKVT